MRKVDLHKNQIYSDDYLLRVAGVPLAGYLVRSAPRIRRFLLTLSGRCRRAICCKVILLTIFAITTGFFVGAIWAILELDGGEYPAEDEVVELIIQEAKI